MIKVYTDGGCNNTTNKIGAYANVIIQDDKIIAQNTQAFENTTNNVMEMRALLSALQYLVKNHLNNEQIEIFADSQYVINGLTQWVNGWKKSNWKNNTVANKLLWIQLDNFYNKFSNIHFTWVKGHNGNQYNELCDSMCTSSMKKLQLDKTPQSYVEEKDMENTLTFNQQVEYDILSKLKKDDLIKLIIQLKNIK